MTGVTLINLVFDSITLLTTFKGIVCIFTRPYVNKINLMNVVFCAWSQSALNLRHQSIAKYRGDIGTRGEASRVPEICTHHMYSNLKYTRFLDYFANFKYVNLLLASRLLLVLISIRKMMLIGFCWIFSINRNVTKISLDAKLLHIIQQINIILTIEEYFNQDNKMKMVLRILKIKVRQQRHSSNEVFWCQEA